MAGDQASDGRIDAECFLRRRPRRYDRPAHHADRARAHHGPLADLTRTKAGPLVGQGCLSGRAEAEFSGWRRQEADVRDRTPDRQVPARTELERLLRDLDRTYEESAAWFEQVAAGMGEGATITARHLRRLASGERQGTTPSTRRVLQKMFGHPVRVLLSTADPTTASPGIARQTPEAPAATEKEILQMAALRARNFTLGASASDLTGEGLDQLNDDVALLTVAYQKRPISEFLPFLAETQNIVFSLLEGKQPPAYTRRLLLLAGVTSGLLAKVSHDLGDPHTALTQSRTAFLCADNADHNGIRAWIRGLQSLITYWAGRPNEAARYAQQGAEYGTRGTTSAWLPVSEARAWAAMGNAESAGAAIDRATEARERIRPDDIDELGGLCTFSYARQLYYASDALAWFPERAPAAEQHAIDALTTYEDTESPGWSFGDAAGAATNLAIARVARREVDGALEAVRPVLDLPPEQRIHGIVESINRVQRALSSLDASPARSALQEQIESFIARPARAALYR
jgi:hypothetical protein